jgi:hypothetical protein
LSEKIVKFARSFFTQGTRSCLALLLSMGAVLLHGGCATGESMHSEGADGLKVNVEVRAASAELPKALKSVRLWLSPTQDARPRPGSKQIGHIKATVVDVHSAEMRIEEAPDQLAGSALKSQLLRDGYQIVETGQDYDYELGSTIRKFEFNVAAQDEIRLLMDLTLKKNGSASPLWRAQVEESTDRFSGISGNSRSTLSAYLERGIANWVNLSSAQIRIGLEPFISLPVPAVAPAVESHQGWIAITTDPANAKVYIDNVYFGKTPLRARVPQGVVALEIRREGYKSIKEKVSIRNGETTEWESTLNKI